MAKKLEREVKVEEHNESTLFHFNNGEPGKRGYAIIHPNIGGTNIPFNIKMYIPRECAFLSQFYPNGRNAPELEMRQGKGTQMLNFLIGYLKYKKINAVYCYSSSESMKQFMKKRSFLELSITDYLLNF